MSPDVASEGFTLNTPEAIEAYRLLAIKMRLRMELRGLTFRGRSTFAIVREMLKMPPRTPRNTVYKAYLDKLEAQGLPVTEKDRRYEK